MLVVMNVTITGTRENDDWPPAGGSIDLVEAEACDLIAAGLARPAVEAAIAPPAETATIDRRPARKVRAAAVTKSGGQW